MLTTLEAVKLDLRIADDTEDAWLTMAIEQASAAVETFCNQKFGGEDGTEPVPADVQRAVHVTIATWWFARGRDPALRSEDVEGLGAVTLFVPTTALPGEAEALLALHIQHVGFA